MNEKHRTVIAVNSSNRKGNTFRILKVLKESLSELGIETEMVHLADYEVKHCTGCERCIRGKECPLKDDTPRLLQKLFSSDGIIMSSPVYMGSVTGRLKTFFDRTCHWYHRPALAGKPALLVVTTAGSYAAYTAKYMQRTIIGWGLHPIGTILRKVKTLHKNIQRDEYDRFVHCLHTPSSEYRPSIAQLIHFQVQKVLALKILEIDKTFWKSKGWDSSIYYYRCRIGPLKYLFSMLFYRLLFSRVKKTSPEQ
jgi:multimeric flavodoxin WrbA